jgi:hypothetical protein
MPDDGGTAWGLAMQLRAGADSAPELPDELRSLMTAPVREAIATILLGGLAQRIRPENTTADPQQKGCA